MKYLACGVHAVLLISVFDIYFKSPIIPNLPNIGNPYPALAKRLVLIVSDGLRADKFYETRLNTSNAPYLRYKILNEGIWGVSKSHIPTESRPGHVSLIAGIYEDPSAVFKGWKHNPVEFDSVFNQSSQTFAWGSPDILTIFNKGNESCRIDDEIYYTESSYKTCRVRTEMYSPAFQDFSGANNSASDLNFWVLNKFLSFMELANSSNSVRNSIMGDKIVFFLHLLGTDVSGHVNKPYSDEYMYNINVSDDIVKRVEAALSEFYKDNLTAFVFTSDHGMSDWGSHGAGSVSETDTPIVAWGAGISKPVVDRFRASDTPLSWDLSHLIRLDVNQSDIAPLMSVLLGIGIPANSIGVLPVNILASTETNKANLLYLNARQIEKQFIWKRDQIKKSVFDIFFEDYPMMTVEEQNQLNERIKHCFFSNGTKCMENSFIHDLINKSVSGIEFYDNFHQTFLRTLITLSFLGWMLYMSLSLIECSLNKMGAAIVHMKENGLLSKRLKPIDIIFFTGGIASSVVIAIQSYPVLVHVYIWMAVMLWWMVIRTAKEVKPVLQFLRKNIFSVLKYGIIYLLGLEILVFSFFKREMLTLVMLVLIPWPLSKREMYKHTYVLTVWVLSCLCLACFPMLPTVGFDTNSTYLLSCGFVWISVGIYLVLNNSFKFPLNLKLLCLALIEIATALLNIYFMSYITDTTRIYMHAVSWIILASSLLLLNYGPDTIYARYLHIVFNMCSPYLLLSIGHEAYFTLFLAINLMCWIYFEHQLSCYWKLTHFPICPGGEEQRLLSADDIRKAFFFVFYIFISFFGIGNIASLNSFDLRWVRCFISVFSPFTMTGLILLKTLIPFLIVAVAFRLINLMTQVNTKQVFLVVLVMCDIMGLNFFFRITNKGSWLDIGLSISHYVIVQTILLFFLGVYATAVFLTKPCVTKIIPSQDKDTRVSYFIETHED